MKVPLRAVPLLALLIVLVPQASRAGDFDEVEKRIVEHTLPNGLQLIILERHVAPVMTCFTMARVGAADERPGITGLAHLFEHMAFKGTDTIGTNNFEAEVEAMARVDESYAALVKAQREGADAVEIARLEDAFKKAQDEASEYAESEFDQVLQRNGGSGLNAFTSSDQTGYIVNLPSNKLELWAALESERFLRPILREFYKERNVVQEERRMRTDSNPMGRFIEESLAAAFRAHPYGWPVVGHMSDIQTVTREDAREFFETYYVASNLIVVIVGDVNPQETVQMVEKYFGRLPKKPEPPRVRTVEPPQLGERIVILDDPAQPIYACAYHKTSATHPDDIVFDALSDILGSGRSSRLYKSLVKEKKIATQVAAMTGWPGNRYPNLFLVYAVPAAGHTADDVEKEILAEIERIREEPVTEEELRGMKTRARAGLIRGMQSNFGMAYALASYADVTGDWRTIFRQVERVQQISVEDIQRVAQEYLTRKNRTTAKLMTTRDEEPTE